MKFLYLLLLLILALAVTFIEAGSPPKYYQERNSITVVNDDITVQVIGDGLPRLIISSNSDNGTQYDLSFNSMFQVSQMSGSQKQKVGNTYSLSSYSWVLGDPIVLGDMVTFSLAGAKDLNNPFVTFTVLVNSTGMSYKFNVDISNFQSDMWQRNAVGLATCYTAKTKLKGNNNEQNVTVQATSNSNQYTFGGSSLSIVPYAVLINSTQTVTAQLQPGDGNNVACIVYESFIGKAIGLVHDPTAGMSDASSIQVSFMVLATSFLLYFLF